MPKEIRGFQKGQTAGSKNVNWKGGKYKSYQGYILILKSSHPRANKQGYVKQTNLVMEKQLGRYLKPEEEVHHINRIKDDDRPENLRLFKNHSEHQKTCHKPPCSLWFKKGEHASLDTEFKKGHKSTHGFKKGNSPWNKGEHPEYVQGKNHPMYGKKGEHNSPATEFKKGQHGSPKTEFKKGHIPWNKGKHSKKIHNITTC